MLGWEPTLRYPGKPSNSRTMKIAYLFDTFPSPTETFLAREIAALRARGADIEIWALHPAMGARPIQTPSRLVKLAGKLARDARFWRATGEGLARELSRSGVTHVHAAWANYVADIARYAARKADLPWSFAAHARDLWVEGGDLQAKLARAKWAAVCTRAGENELRKWGDNVIYAPHGIELNRYRFRAWEVGPMRLLGVGRLVEKKGWPDGVEAAKILGAQLQIIGEGPLRAQLPASALRGELSHQSVIETMRNWANCLVLPSRLDTAGDRDGLANVLLEGAALGLPLVTTTAGSASDLVDDETGWLCAPDDARALAQTLARVWARPDETRRRCLQARARVENEFDVAVNVEVLERAFRGRPESVGENF